MSDGADRRIVVGVEGSGYAREALIWAIEEARHRGAVVEVVTCYSPTYVPAAPDLGYVPLDSFDLAAEVEKMQSEVIDSAIAASPHGADVEITRVLKKGRPMYGGNLYNGTERVAHFDIAIPNTPYMLMHSF